MGKDYVVVTTITQFRHRYVMHKDDLQKLNPDVEVEPVEWACDTVVAEEVEEFSQRWFGETIIDTANMTEDEMLELFDKDNDYLKGWTRKEKIDLVRGNLKGEDAHG
jgi:hypothetical protein